MPAALHTTSTLLIFPGCLSRRRLAAVVTLAQAWAHRMWGANGWTQMQGYRSEKQLQPNHKHPYVWDTCEFITACLNETAWINGSLFFLIYELSIWAQNQSSSVHVSPSLLPRLIQRWTSTYDTCWYVSLSPDSLTDCHIRLSPTWSVAAASGGRRNKERASEAKNKQRQTLQRPENMKTAVTVLVVSGIKWCPDSQPGWRLRQTNMPFRCLECTGGS